MNDIRIYRVFSMPSKWTFEIKPIKALVSRYVSKATRILIPFAGITRFDLSGKQEATYIDIEPGLPDPYIKGDANDVLEGLDGKYDLAIVDPPYSMYQSIKTYNNKKFQEITHVRRLVDSLLATNGICVSFGFNSTGMSARRCYDKIELLIVNLGGSHNDILVLVEKKTGTSLDEYN